MRINYSGEKRRRELALKQKKEDKAKKIAERKLLKAQQSDETGIDPSQDALDPADEAEESDADEETT